MKNNYFITHEQEIIAIGRKNKVDAHTAVSIFWQQQREAGDRIEDAEGQMAEYITYNQEKYVNKK